MKCKYCGAPIGLEDKFCGNCGKPNEIAKQHVHDMDMYSRDYTRTKTNVENEARKWTGIAVRAIVVLILVVLFIGLSYVKRSEYSIRRNYQKKQAEKNSQEYTKIMDKYLKEQDYLAYHRFVQGYGIPSYSDEYEEYTYVNRAVTYYLQIEAELIHLRMPGQYDEPSRVAGSVSNYIESYYDYVIDTRKLYTDGEYSERQGDVDKVTEKLERLLVVELGMDEETVKSLPDKSKVERASIINTAMSEITAQMQENQVEEE